MWAIVWTLCVGYLVGHIIGFWADNSSDDVFILQVILHTVAIIIVCVGTVLSICGYPVFGG